MIRDFSELNLLKDNKLLLSKAGILMLTRSDKYFYNKKQRCLI